MITAGLEVIWVLLAVVGNVKDLDVNLSLAIIPQYKRVPIAEVEGVGEVTPSPTDIQVASWIMLKK